MPKSACIKLPIIEAKYDMMTIIDFKLQVIQSQNSFCDDHEILLAHLLHDKKSQKKRIWITIHANAFGQFSITIPDEMSVNDKPMCDMITRKWNMALRAPLVFIQSRVCLQWWFPHLSRLQQITFLGLSLTAVH